jgi:hypothetical protein
MHGRHQVGRDTTSHPSRSSGYSRVRESPPQGEDVKAVKAVFQELGPCPCGSPRCDVVGTKLTRFGHLVGCKSEEATGRRNRRKGQAGQARTHKRLGGQGWTPSNEESARPYGIVAAWWEDVWGSNAT